jgi:hypothetical protein
MIGGCVLSGKYNMSAMWYQKSTSINSNTGQVKAEYLAGQEIVLVARGLANLRGKDSGTMQDYGNMLNEYHYLRIKTMQKMDEGDVVTQIKDANGELYLDGDVQFVILGVTPTYEPFGSFMEYDVLANKAEVYVKLPNEFKESQEATELSSSGVGVVVDV